MTIEKSVVVADLRQALDWLKQAVDEYDSSDVPTETRETGEWLRAMKYARNKVNGAIDLLERGGK